MRKKKYYKTRYVLFSAELTTIPKNCFEEGLFTEKDIYLKEINFLNELFNSIIENQKDRLIGLCKGVEVSTLTRFSLKLDNLKEVERPVQYFENRDKALNDLTKSKLAQVKFILKQKLEDLKEDYSLSFYVSVEQEFNKNKDSFESDIDKRQDPIEITISRIEFYFDQLEELNTKMHKYAKYRLKKL